jgi:pyruvate formate lyase activating enzyme
VKNLIEYVDLFLIDIKHMDPQWHQKVTWQSNENTLKFIDYLQDLGKKIWIRYVYVPWYTDQPEYVEALGKKFGSYSCIERLELLPYHKLGAYKRKELGWKYELEWINSPSMDIVDGVKKLLEKYFKKVVIR